MGRDGQRPLTSALQLLQCAVRTLPLRPSPENLEALPGQRNYSHQTLQSCSIHLRRLSLQTPSLDWALCLGGRELRAWAYVLASPTARLLVSSSTCNELWLPFLTSRIDVFSCVCNVTADFLPRPPQPLGSGAGFSVLAAGNKETLRTRRRKTPNSASPMGENQPATTPSWPRRSWVCTHLGRVLVARPLLNAVFLKPATAEALVQGHAGRSNSGLAQAQRQPTSLPSYRCTRNASDRFFSLHCGFLR